MTLDTSYDLELNNSENIRYYPWIGKDYRNQNFKILILGESHYYGESISEDEKNRIDNDKDHTRKCYYGKLCALSIHERIIGQ